MKIDTKLTIQENIDNLSKEIRDNPSLISELIEYAYHLKSSYIK